MFFGPISCHTCLHGMLSVADDSHSTNDNVDDFSSDYMANGIDITYQYSFFISAGLTLDDSIPTLLLTVQVTSTSRITSSSLPSFE